MIFRQGFFRLPFSATPGTSINLWAIVVDERKKFGTLYSSIEQITTSGTEVTLSPKISVAVRAPRP
jgi:hypothetical protein